MSLARSTPPWRHTWDCFEAIVGLIVMFMLSFGPPTAASLGLMISLVTSEWTAAVCCALIIVVTAPVAVWLARMAGSAVEEFLSRSSARPAAASDNFDKTALNREVPFALLMVGELPRMPVIARIPLAIWWLLHFAAAAGVVVISHLPLRQGMNGPGLAQGLFAVMLCLLFTFAANVFLLLAVSVGFWSATITACVWRHRFLIDVLLILPALLGVVF